MVLGSREHAQSLRRIGKSIRDISQILRISKSTVSHWCRDIILSKQQLAALAEQQQRGGALGRLRAAEQKRADRIQRTRDDATRGAQEVDLLSHRDIFILGLALYWGEGYKNDNGECGLTNSDPGIILGFISWLRMIYGIERIDLIARVSLNQAHFSRVKVVEKYWSGKIGIPLSQFTQTNLIKTTSRKKYRHADQHFGTLRLKVRKATSLRRRIMGSIEEMGRQLAASY